jgi:ABC-type phosphate transport system substrate-binding protein
MTGLNVRGLAAALGATAISAVAFIAPGTASAACTGVSIKGNGSSLQAAAQQKYWSPAFNVKCEGTGHEQVEYESTSSGKGLASWWVGHSSEKYKGFGANNAFVGTDQPPNETQEKEINEKSVEPANKILSIPVLQAAVALPIHLPEGCTATSGKKGKGPKRLVLSDADLQAIFAHAITKWSQLPAFNDNALVGASCDKEAPIIRVVRKEGSGTTAILKKFLFEINKSPVDGSESWNELAEKNENLNWPDETEGLVKAEKGSGIASTVASTAGSIGYANLNEVRANTAFTPAGGGGEGGSIFWPELQNKGKKYQDPSTDGESNTAASANCAAEAYVSLNKTGKQGKFPPESTEDVWNEVTASTVQKKSYSLCGFTYDVSLTDFAGFSESGSVTSKEEVETLKNYLSYVLTTGQGALSGNDFLALPSGKKGGNVLKIAQEGVAKIAY